MTVIYLIILTFSFCLQMAAMHPRSVAEDAGAGLCTHSLQPVVLRSYQTHRQVTGRIGAGKDGGGAFRSLGYNSRRR